MDHCRKHWNTGPELAGGQGQGYSRGGNPALAARGAVGTQFAVRNVEERQYRVKGVLCLLQQLQKKANCGYCTGWNCSILTDEEQIADELCRCWGGIMKHTWASDLVVSTAGTFSRSVPTIQPHVRATGCCFLQILGFWCCSRNGGGRGGKRIADRCGVWVI